MKILDGRTLTRGAGVFFLLLSVTVAELERHPQQYGVSFDMGQAIRSDEATSIQDNQFLSRTGVFLTTSATYDQKFDIGLTIGGLFWYALPTYPVRFATEMLVLFGAGVGQAQGTYKFGDPKAPSATLQMGLFGHKYNPDAKNLGEYLYRSGTYPGYLWTGGWSYVNSAAYLAQGLRFSVPTFNGMLTHDLTLYMERDFAPAHDLTPSYQLTFKPSSSFEAGFGLAWAHGISFRPDSILSPRTRRNAYNPDLGLPLTPEDQGKTGYVYYGSGDPRNDTRVVPDGDPLIGSSIPDSIPDPNNAGQMIANPDPNVGEFYISVTDNGTPKNLLEYYTFKGFKGMLRAALDIGNLMGDAVAPNTFKIYGEVALLGIKDYPFYYEKKTERMPVMMGINLPTFGLLDVFSFEMEYLNSPFKNSIASIYDLWEPTPLGSEANTLYHREKWKSDLLPDPSDPTYAASLVSYDSLTSVLEKKAEEDNWKWSVYAKRKITDGLSLTGQVASDHIRHFEIVYGQPSKTSATLKPSQWYYILRLELGI